MTNKEWFVYDGLGSCRAMVKPNAQGTDAVLVARYDYDVYGAVRTSSGSSANKFKYVAGIGHPTDEETGLIYMRARYYEPGTGRFVSEDPGLHGLNWYVYANNAPTGFVDSTGKFALSIIGALFVVFGIALTRSKYDIEVLSVGAGAAITSGQILTVVGVLLVLVDAALMYNSFLGAINAIQQLKQRQMQSGEANLFERTGNLIALHIVETTLWLFEDHFD